MTAGDGRLDLVRAETARRILDEDLGGVRAVVEQTYVLHGTGRTVNPPAQRLAVPGRPASRIMALPAYVAGDRPASGIKWVASYPDNHDRGLPRATAVLILNDEATGRPYACLEASHISAARTAASAVVAADELSGGRRPQGTLAVCGAGVLARWTYRFLRADGWEPETVAVFDTSAVRSRAFASWVACSDERPVTVCGSAEEAVRRGTLVVLATTATAPHLGPAVLAGAAPLVLHISLRDLTPGAVVAGQNFVDDPDHAFRGDTSLALALAARPTGDFYTGSLYDVMRGGVEVDPSRPRIFSPFGLGVLDVAVGKLVYDRAVDLGAVVPVPDFFSPEPVGSPGCP